MWTNWEKKPTFRLKQKKNIYIYNKQHFTFGVRIHPKHVLFEDWWFTDLRDCVFTECLTKSGSELFPTIKNIILWNNVFILQVIFDYGTILTILLKVLFHETSDCNCIIKNIKIIDKQINKGIRRKIRLNPMTIFNRLFNCNKEVVIDFIP